MKGQLAVDTPEAYIAKLAEPRRSDIAALHALITEAAPELRPVIQSGMLGYGPYHYKYKSGRQGESCRIMVASNATAISMYIAAADGEHYVAERFKPELPKASIGKSCVKFKRLSDLDRTVLTRLIQETAAACR